MAPLAHSEEGNKGSMADVSNNTAAGQDANVSDSTEADVESTGTADNSTESAEQKKSDAGMATLKELFGDVLLTKAGEKPTEEVLAGKTSVGIYFSGHWCGPCRGFTPKLRDAYNDALKGKGMEIIFVSADRDQTAFDNYYANDHPWAALPYSNRQKASALNKKYKVQGIPSFVILKSDGETITTEGRSKITEDPKGDKYPWIPPTAAEKIEIVKDILGPEFMEKAAGRYIGLYFSAHWCPPCKMFTPELVGWYNAGLKDNMEVIFISSDRDEEAYKAYCAEQPWGKLPWDKRKEKQELSNMFQVEGIPTFVVLNPDGSLLTKDGRSKVTADPKGETLPNGWLPQPFNNCNDDPDDLNEETCLIALGKNSAMSEAVKAVAMEHYAKANKDISAMKYRFFNGPDGRVIGQIRRLTKLDDGQDYLLLIDIPDDGGFYISAPKETSNAVQEFLADFEAGKLERKQLQK